MTITLSKPILKGSLVALEWQHNNLPYQNIDIGAGIMIVDLDQPNIIVPLVSIFSDHKKGMYKYICPWLFFASLLTVFVNELVT